MARQWRIQYPGAIYHVMSRGNGGQRIFISDQDRSIFLSLLELLAERYNIEIHAYVLMNNHYHLLIKTIDANLSRAMQWFGTTYTRWFNMVNIQSGHLFQGRYKSIIVQNDAYLLRLSCYIHRNPVRAGIIGRLADYPWSSYMYYAYKKIPPPWLHTESIFSQLTGNDRHRAYRTKTQHYADEDSSIWEDVKHGLIYGSQTFVTKIKDRYLSDNKKDELPQHNSMLREYDSEELLSRAAKMLKFDLSAASKAKKISSDEKDKRDLLIYLLWQRGRLSNSAIGAHFGLTYSSISRRVKIVNDSLSINSELSKKYDRLKSQIKV
jgi:REP element-mobilizing transposase RayT